jgi:hypothetical protein
VLVAALGCGAVIAGVSSLLEARFGLETLVARLIVLAGSSLAGGVTYLALARAMGIREFPRLRK